MSLPLKDLWMKGWQQDLLVVWICKVLSSDKIKGLWKEIAWVWILPRELGPAWRGDRRKGEIGLRKSKTDPNRSGERLHVSFIPSSLKVIVRACSEENPAWLSFRKRLGGECGGSRNRLCSHSPVVLELGIRIYYHYNLGQMSSPRLDFYFYTMEK